MTFDIGFEAVPGLSDFKSNDAFAKLAIFTSKAGRTLYQGQLRDRNASLVAGPQDPAYGNPQWNGVPVEGVQQIADNYLDPAANYTTAYTKPPFWFLNFNFIEIAFQEGAFMQKRPPINGGRQQPDTDTLFMFCHPAVACSSRRRQGVLYGA